MRSIASFFLVVLLGLPAVPAAHASDTQSLPAKFLGSWEGTGTVLGREGAFTMRWSRVLDNALYHLEFSNPFIRAEGFYQPKEGGTYSGTWVDSRGVIQPLRGVVEESTFEVSWGTPETEQGRTRYTWTGPDAITVTDFVLRNGEWAPFGEAQYRRALKGLAGLSWLLGDWTRETEKSVTVEQWRRDGAGSYVGEGVRTSQASGEVVFTERLRLVEMGDAVYYLADVAENAVAIAFELTEVDTHRAVFENPDHDFPQKLVYELDPETRSDLTVTASGADGDKELVFRFRRTD